MPPRVVCRSHTDSTLQTSFPEASTYLRDVIPRWQVDSSLNGCSLNGWPSIADCPNPRILQGAKLDVWSEVDYLVIPENLALRSVGARSVQPTFPNVSLNFLPQWDIVPAGFLSS